MRALLLACLTVPLVAAAQDCAPPDAPRTRLRALAAAGWVMDDASQRNRLAIGLLACLADPDPELRDVLAFTGLSAWLRAGALDGATVRQIGDRARAQLAAPDAAGFGPPFAALVLAEVARVDRLRAFWTATERDDTLAAASRYMAALRDYRGFDPAQGWRHGVAHGADLLMQLALNPALDRGQLDRILEAVLSQAAPGSHFYIFGEGERLARPVLFVARRGLHDAADWTAWLTRLAGLGAAPRSAPPGLEALARQHNAKALLLALYATVQEGNDGALRLRLLPGLSAALRLLD